MHAIEDLFLLFIRPMNRLKLPYMVTGAAAAIIYGEPRMTHDVDLVLDIEAKNLNPFIKTFSLKQFYCPPKEVIGVEIKRSRRGHFNLIHLESGFKADVYLMGEDPLHRWAMGLRRSVMMGGEVIWVSPPEYVIIRKLEYFKEGGSEKHARDIQGMLEISGKLIDMDFLEEKVNIFGLEQYWTQVKKMLPG
jgi:hypothetical protein